MSQTSGTPPKTQPHTLSERRTRLINTYQKLLECARLEAAHNIRTSDAAKLVCMVDLKADNVAGQNISIRTCKSELNNSNILRIDAAPSNMQVLTP